jgi:hypothetical protein
VAVGPQAHPLAQGAPLQEPIASASGASWASEGGTAKASSAPSSPGGALQQNPWPRQSPSTSPKVQTAPAVAPSGPCTQTPPSAGHSGSGNTQQNVPASSQVIVVSSRSELGQAPASEAHWPPMPQAKPAPQLAEPQLDELLEGAELSPDWQPPQSHAWTVAKSGTIRMRRQRTDGGLLHRACRPQRATEVRGTMGLERIADEVARTVGSWCTGRGRVKRVRRVLLIPSNPVAPTDLPE